jgi:hypothetical protein
MSDRAGTVAWSGRAFGRARASAPLLVGLLLTGLASTRLEAAGPAVRFITVTDVTPRSFRIAWLSAEPGTGTLRLFEAPECSNEIFTAEITSLAPPPTVGGSSSGSQNGVLIAKVAELEPDTEYCVKTVTTSSFSNQITIAPEPALRVRTEKRTTRSRAVAVGDPNEASFSNDLAQVSVVRADPTLPTAGMLVLLKVKGASSPLAAFVGDGIDDDGNPGTPTTLALLDLNNLYDAATHESLDLKGDGSEEISARVLGGPEGFVRVQARTVPADAGLNEVVVPGPCRNSTLTACDGRLGDADADGTIADADARQVRDLVVGLLPILPCMVCGDATWDFDDDMHDALAIGQAAAGRRLLPW